MHLTRGILVRAAIVIGIPISWWIGAAIAWRHLLNITHPSFNLRDFLVLEGADRDGVVASLFVGFLIAAALGLMVSILTWIHLSRVSDDEEFIGENETRYTLLRCHEPKCRCVRHGNEHYDTVKGEWLTVCRDAGCRCGYHEGECYDIARGEWVDDPSDQEGVSSFVDPAN